MSRPEILAPAGSFESLVAAAVCGADAVYLGGKALNARRNAGNFDDDELARAVAYCHVRGVKVYQTLNTILFDEEEEELIAAAKTAAAAGVDGIIVQDIGVLSLLRECVPQIPLAASTQMAIHNLAGAKEAERLGCKVVVLARELTASEIERITKNLTTAETEVFVHGALCMCVSGQCYMSAMLGGRSGNRGLCAQPCRLPFSAGKKTHALSLKDLSLVPRVDELCAAGVASLKIEGRMKRPEYVAASVTALKAALDGGKPDMQTLQSVFSRSGFTTGYFDDRRDGAMFGTRQKEDVVAARDVLDSLSKLAVRETPRVGLFGTLTAVENEPVILTVHDGEGHSAEARGDIPLIAENRPTDEARAKAALEKTGGTPFFWRELSVVLGEGLLIPASALNSLRREALALIEAQRAAEGKTGFVEPAPLTAARRRQGKKKLYARCTARQLSAALVDTCDRVIVPITDMKKAAGCVPTEKLAIELPRVLFSGEEKLPALLEEAKALGIKYAWCGNLYAVRMAREAGLEIMGGWSLNLANSRAFAAAEELGIKEAEATFELSAARMKKCTSPMPVGMVGYGHLPLMVFRNCPMKAAIGCEKCRQRGELTDRTGTKFTLSCRDGVTELYNSVPLYLADKPELMAGTDYVTLWFTKESAQSCADIADQYARNAPKKPAAGFTRGLYQRGVQ